MEGPMKKRLLFIAGTILVLGLAYGGLTRVVQEKEQAHLKFLASSQGELFVPKASPKLGTDTPKVYLTEFLDPACESCRAFYPIVKKLMAEFDGKVQLVVRYAPFHQGSDQAVKILEAARKQDRYQGMLELMFIRQPEWASHHQPKPELLWGYAEELGLDMEQLRRDFHDPGIAALLAQDIKDLKTLNVRRTPTFFVNGNPLQDFSVDGLRALLAKEIAEAG